MPKFRQQATFVENLLKNDEATFLLIRDCLSYLEEYTGPLALNHIRMHILFEGIADELLEIAMAIPNSTSSFGTISLEELLSQRLQHLLLVSFSFSSVE
jgi:hypothetical protein